LFRLAFGGDKTVKINKLTLKDFTVFGEAEFDFSPGLNVLIGANGTGKSHVLKVLYSVNRPRLFTSHDNMQYETYRVPLRESILKKFQGTFRVSPTQGPLDCLVRCMEDYSIIRVQGNMRDATVEIKKRDNPNIEIKIHPYPKDHQYYFSVVFIPTNEVLSMYPGFIPAYEKRELSFDETYRDLCVDLSENPLREVWSPALEPVAMDLERSVGGKTEIQGNTFFVALRKDWLLEVPMLAEGHRKLGSIAHLIRNGSIAENSILFWDEPETNINPKLITLVAKTLMDLAGAGVQVFVATHDYLLTNELSIAAEYGTEPAKKAQTKFFALSKADFESPVEVESGNTLADLEHNPIMEEFAAHYDREQKLFQDSGMDK
jgi:ABC-type ATPase involved in cell division